MKRHIFIPLIFLFILILSGTIGYVIIEDYTPGEGLYMTIITITTVGFGEVRPLTPTGRFLTTILIFLGFINLAFVGHAFLEIFFEKIVDPHSARKRMIQQIQNLHSHYIICGFGRVGAAAAQRFCDLDVDFVIIDAKKERCQELSEKGLLYIEGDAIDETILQLAGIKRANGLLTLLPSVPDNLFITLTARELNPTLHIIARADNEASERKLIRAGADEVISPYKTAGLQMAIQMLSATGDLSIQALANVKDHSGLQWLVIDQDSDWLHKPIANIQQENHVRILGIRRGHKDTLFPKDNFRIKIGDKLLIITKTSERPLSSKIKERHKILIVDDNPVILRLYTRLLRRAGFHPITAADGKEALTLILNERPDAAVLDYMLPGLSGIEICHEVRRQDALNNIKLILFTTDDQAETRLKALEAGANAVVVKSADAHELIETVIQILQQEQLNPQESVKVVDVKEILSTEIIPDLDRQSSMTPSLESHNEQEEIFLTKRNSSASNKLFSEDTLQQQVDNDKNLLIEIISIFQDDASRLLEQIQEAISSKDNKMLQRTAHTLKGSLATLAANSPYQKAQELEKLAKDGNMDGAAKVFHKLKNEIEHLKEELQSYLKKDSVG
ncbi:MAG: NAD-binding protein [candidate division KSB1 bacterium]|nr:NAD-binding protein [candidate division KSB1 bacterium]